MAILFILDSRSFGLSDFLYGCDRLCTASLPSDITVVVDGVNFHIHKVLFYFVTFYSTD